MPPLRGGRHFCGDLEDAGRADDEFPARRHSFHPRQRGRGRLLSSTLLLVAGLSCLSIWMYNPQLSSVITSDSDAGWGPSLWRRAKSMATQFPGSSWKLCGFEGFSCHCQGTVALKGLLSETVSEVHSDGEVVCGPSTFHTASAHVPRLCWCQEGPYWGDHVQQGIATMVRQGLVPRVEISTELQESDIGFACDPSTDGLWYSCALGSTSVTPWSPEDRLDATLRAMDQCLQKTSSGSGSTMLRLLAIRSQDQALRAIQAPLSAASACSVVYSRARGPFWGGKPTAPSCATQPGTCTTLPCNCDSHKDLQKLELTTKEGRRCWVCASPGRSEESFREGVLEDQISWGPVSGWLSPSAINCPPMFWMLMDWRAVMAACPVSFAYMCIFVFCILLRKGEECSGRYPLWTRAAPLFGPCLQRGEFWRFFTFSFVHVQWTELLQNLMTFLDALDVEATPSILLSDGSNLKCGAGGKENLMCYPSIGLGSTNVLGVALLSAAIGGMVGTCVAFRGVFAGASILSFGLSGATVALYALYAGAELDHSATVQRSFQDWVWLRLIFVGFHILMEFVRGISQKDAAGLLSHSAALAAGFGYVLYFLPPMGDGSLLPAEQPYVLPCSSSSSTSSPSSSTSGFFFSSSASSSSANNPSAAAAANGRCIRLFSESLEYEVAAVQQVAFLAFTGVVLLTLWNVFSLHKGASSDEAALLGGSEVGEVLSFLFGNSEDHRQKYSGGKGREAGHTGNDGISSPITGDGGAASTSSQTAGQPRQRNLAEGEELILWCDIMGVWGLRPVPLQSELRIEVRLAHRDAKWGDLSQHWSQPTDDSATAAAAATAAVEAAATTSVPSPAPASASTSAAEPAASTSAEAAAAATAAATAASKSTSSTSPPEGASRSTSVRPGAQRLQFGESLFLPAKFSKATNIQILLIDDNSASLGSESELDLTAVISAASLPLRQALRFGSQNHNELKVQLLGSKDGGLGVCSAVVQMVFRILEASDVPKLRQRVQREFDGRRLQLRFVERQLQTLSQAARRAAVSEDVPSAPAAAAAIGHEGVSAQEGDDGEV